MVLWYECVTMILGVFWGCWWMRFRLNWKKDWGDGKKVLGVLTRRRAWWNGPLATAWCFQNLASTKIFHARGLTIERFFYRVGSSKADDPAKAESLMVPVAFRTVEADASQGLGSGDSVSMAVYALWNSGLAGWLVHSRTGSWPDPTDECWWRSHPVALGSKLQWNPL